MMIRKATEPPTAPPIIAPETPLELEAAVAVAVGVLLATVDVLLGIANAVAKGILDESATLRS